jgi:hypothetical protein
VKQTPQPYNFNRRAVFKKNLTTTLEEEVHRIFILKNVGGSTAGRTYKRKSLDIFVNCSGKM